MRADKIEPRKSPVSVGRMSSITAVDTIASSPSEGTVTLDALHGTPEPAHKRYWRENKEKIQARRALRPKAPLRPLNINSINKYKELQVQIKALQIEAKKYVDEVRLMNRRGHCVDPVAEQN